MTTPVPDADVRPVPALITGTSTELLGRRPLPRLVRERAVVFVVGPGGSGKSSVARKLAGPGATVLTTRQLQDALIEHVRFGGWSRELLHAPGLVLDEPVWLRNRPAAVAALLELLRTRHALGLRTMVCQSDRDGSFDELLGHMELGHVVVLGLRLPTGRRGRARFARRMCDRMGLPREAVKGTDSLAPWSYAAVIDHLRAWQRLPFPDYSPEGSSEGSPR